MPQKQIISKKHFLYSYFKIDLSQIIAYIIKIKAIKICHDSDNNLAQKETFTKYAKIEFHELHRSMAAFNRKSSRNQSRYWVALFQLARNVCSCKRSLHLFISNVHLMFLMFTPSLRQVKCRNYYKHSHMKRNQNSQFRIPFPTGFRNKFSSKSYVP